MSHWNREPCRPWVPRRPWVPCRRWIPCGYRIPCRRLLFMRVIGVASQMFLSTVGVQFASESIRSFIVMSILVRWHIAWAGMNRRHSIEHTWVLSKWVQLSLKIFFESLACWKLSSQLLILDLATIEKLIIQSLNLKSWQTIIKLCNLVNYTLQLTT